MQAAKAAPSSAHWKVAPAGVDVKLKLALVLVVDAAGDEVIVVSGGIGAVMVHVKDAGVGSVPAPSTARTWNVWLPSASAVYARGLVQAANAATRRARTGRSRPPAST